MISLKYGTVPLVYKTGGLADTVIDCQKDKTKGNGFVFEKFDKKEFISTVKRALAVFEENKFNSLIGKAFKYNFSWKSSASKYIDLFNRLVKGRV